MRIFKNAYSVTALAFSPDDKQLAVATGDLPDKGALKIWDVKQGSFTQTLHSGSSVDAVVFSPDGTTLAAIVDTVAGEVNVVRLWKVHTGRVLATFRANGHATFASLAFSPDGKILAAGSGNFDLQQPPKVHLWNLSTKVLKKELFTDTRNGNVTTSLAFSPNGRWLVTGTTAFDYETGAIELWATRDYRKRYTVTMLDAEGQLRGVGITPNGKTLFGIGNNVVVRNLHTGQVLYKYQDMMRGTAIAIARSGRFVVTGERQLSGGFAIQLRDRNGRRLRNAVWSVPAEVSSFALSSNDNLLASGHGDGNVRIWHLTTPMQ